MALTAEELALFGVVEVPAVQTEPATDPALSLVPVDAPLNDPGIPPPEKAKRTRKAPVEIPPPGLVGAASILPSTAWSLTTPDPLSRIVRALRAAADALEDK